MRTDKIDDAIARLKALVKEGFAADGELDDIIEDLESVSSAIDADNEAAYWRAQDTEY